MAMIFKDVPFTLDCEIHGIEATVEPRDYAGAVLASIRTRFISCEV
jgi:hypothetical protein